VESLEAERPRGHPRRVARGRRLSVIVGWMSRMVRSGRGLGCFASLIALVMVAGPCVDGGRPTGTSPSSGRRAPEGSTATDAAAQLRGGSGLRIAVRSAEALPDLLAEADLVVEDPLGLRELLRWLAA
jgi:hypothetical protein